jgi:hypothetical protein
MKKIITLLALVFPFITFGQSIENVNPKKAVSGESIVISITGKNSTFTVGKNSVKLLHLTSLFFVKSDSVFATNVSVVNDTLINAVFTLKGNQQSGFYDVIVSNPQATTLTLPKAFVVNYEDPAILSITPAVVKQGDTVDVIIKCAYTHFTKTINSVGFASASDLLPPISITVLDDLTLKCKFIFNYSFYPGEYHMGVSYKADEFVYIEKSFVLNAGPLAPQIISISPNSAYKPDLLEVTIKGKNTFFCKQLTLYNTFTLRNGTSVIWPEFVTCVNDTQATVHFRFASDCVPGQYEVNFGEKIVLPNAFTLYDLPNPPELISFTPSSATTGDSVTIILKGRYTNFFKGKYHIIKLGNKVLGMTPHILNDSEIATKVFFDYYYFPAGKYCVSLYDDLDGHLQAVDSFKLNEGNNPPQLKSISPNNAVQGQMVDVIIKGDKRWLIGHYQSVVLRNAKAKYESIKLNSTNDSTLSTTFNFPFNAPVGVYDVIIGDSANTVLTLPASFTINKGTPLIPSLVSLSPTLANQFDTVLITVKGVNTHFWYSYKASLIASNNANYRFEGVLTKIIDLTTLQCKFILNSNYYPSDTYDFEIQNSFDSILVKKNAFAINRIYVQEPKIIDISPKEALQGQSITMQMKGTSKAFKAGNNTVKLIDSTGKYFIPAASVNYINDSLISAVFALKADDKAQAYSLSVTNQTKLKFDYFYLKRAPFKLLAVSPCWASPMDTATLIITGAATHFNSLSDNIWLESKFGTKILPISISAINDTLTTARFAFKQIDLPGEYNIYLKSNMDNAVMKLQNAFTLTGSLNSSSLVEVSPEKIYSFSKALLTLKAINTHFLTEADTLVISNPLTLETIYPLSMQIIDDTTISAELIMGRGYFDIVVTGKQNYVLYHKLEGLSPVAIDVVSKVEEPLRIFPNPSDGLFTLQVNNAFEQSTVLVFDVYGKEIFNLKNIESSTKIDLSEYANGLYFIKAIKDNTYKTAKIIKQ